MGILKIKDLSLRLGDKPILKNISIDFWEGHIHAVLGPNGAGKSTLAHTIMGLSDYRGAEGEILFEGEPIQDLPINERAARGITLAWQEPARFHGISVREFILAAAAEKEEGEVDRVLRLVALDPGNYRERFVDDSLSGGERKRIELASIAAMRPRVVLMDEPDSGVDIEAINNIFGVLESLKEGGTTVIMITHSPEVVKRADHAFILCGGRLVRKGTVDQMEDYFNGQFRTCKHKNNPLPEEWILQEGAAQEASS